LAGPWIATSLGSLTMTKRGLSADLERASANCFFRRASKKQSTQHWKPDSL
jgi:hypothetical protein